MTAPEAARGGLAGVLAAHVYSPGGPWGTCTCGRRNGPPDRVKPHAEHVAAAVHDWLTALAADEQARERVAMNIMAEEHVGRSDLKMHPLEWHWENRFNDGDRHEYRLLADAAVAAFLATMDA